MDGTSPKERRMISRLPASTLDSIRLRFDADEGDVLAIVENISISGMGIRTEQPLETGTLVLLEPGSSNRRSPELKAEVRHSRKCVNDGYLAGCRFSRLLTADDTMVLG